MKNLVKQFEEHAHPELKAASEMMKHDPRKVLEMVDRFATKNPDNWLTHLLRIHAYNRLESWDDSLAEAHKYVAYRPDHYQPYWKRAEVNYRLGFCDEAIADVHRAICFDENNHLNSWPYRLMAMCHASKGNLQEGLRNAFEAEQREPHDWFPPVSVFPSGTMDQFKVHLTRLADGVRAPEQPGHG